MDPPHPQTQATRPAHPPAHGQATQQLVAQGLSLGHGAQAAVGHLLGVQLHRVWGKLEALLHHAGQLADAAALLACRGGQGSDEGGSVSTDVTCGLFSRPSGHLHAWYGVISTAQDAFYSAAG
jgi:hypothetical protein